MSEYGENNPDCVNNVNRNGIGYLKSLYCNMNILKYMNQKIVNDEDDQT